MAPACRWWATPRATACSCASRWDRSRRWWRWGRGAGDRPLPGGHRWGGVRPAAAGDLGDWHAAAGCRIPAWRARQRRGERQDARTQPRAGRGRTGASRVARPRGGNQGAGGQAGRTGVVVRRARGQGPGSCGGHRRNSPSCPSGETYCAYVEECRDLRTSPLDCGACGTRCPSLVCQEGRCLSEEEADAAGIVAGGDVLRPRGWLLRRSADRPLNCGACGEQCAVNDCTGGVCGDASASFQNCAPPFAVCGGACVDTSSDPLNCGACGVACGTDEVCSNLLCVPAGGGGGCVTGLTS